MDTLKIINKLEKFKKHEQAILLLSRCDYDKELKKYIFSVFDDYLFDWDKFIGLAISHRVNGVMYKNVCEDYNIPQKVRTIFTLLYYSQIERNKIHQKYIFELNRYLENTEIKFSFLKGAILNTMIFNPGERISNDTDILVSVEDLDACISLCNKLGYKEGRIRNGRFYAATKQELLFAKINTYEIVPFIKQFNNIVFPFHEVDINYRLNNAEDTETTTFLLDETVKWEKNNIEIRAMGKEKFLIYLCVHLFREAMMIFKINNGDDMLLYKFTDIHYFLTLYKDQINWTLFEKIVLKINKYQDIYYTLHYTEVLYPNTVPKNVLTKLRPPNLDFLNQYKGRDNTSQTYNWKSDFTKRFFNLVARKNEAYQNIKEEVGRFEQIMKDIR